MTDRSRVAEAFDAGFEDARSGTTLTVRSATVLRTEEVDAACALLARAYHGSKMPSRFSEGLRAGGEQYVVRASRADRGLVGIAVIKELRGANDDIHVASDSRYYFKHFCVAPQSRGGGIGAAIIALARDAASSILRLPVLWSASSEVGALALYVRSGALLYDDDVRGWSEKHSAEDNAALLRFFMSAPQATAFRLPRDVRFCWPLDSVAERGVVKRGFSHQPMPTRT